MAGISKKRDSYYCNVRIQGVRHTFPLGKITEEQARARAAEADETLSLLKRGVLRVPEGMDLLDFIASGGKLTAALALPDALTIADLRTRYVEAHKNGTVEANSLNTARCHLGQFVTTLGVRFPVRKLSPADLQKHIDRRAKKVSAATLKKEMASLRACWNWAKDVGQLKDPWPGRGLLYPKEEEKEPFRNLAEVEAILDRERPGRERRAALWEALYLTRDELAGFLEHVRENATLPWVFPMAAFAAYTGARRSEMLRALVSDVDFASNTVTIREKKRVKGKRSTRATPLPPQLVAVLRDWLAAKPESNFLFCQPSHVARSRTKRSAPTPVTINEAQDHLKRTLEGSRWENVRGWHVLRHSFVSACVSKGIDQRLIQAWCGHMSADMSRRYSHLYPSVQQEAIRVVFG